MDIAVPADLDRANDDISAMWDKQARADVCVRIDVDAGERYDDALDGE
ncbi:MAG: hypothetical protein ACLP8X_15515 [Streptosporangiaceae bacterium]